MWLNQELLIYLKLWKVALFLRALIDLCLAVLISHMKVDKSQFWQNVVVAVVVAMALTTVKKCMVVLLVLTKPAG